jgi:YggT family protein
VNALSCNLSQFLIILVNIYTIVLLVYAVLSWIPDLRGRWSDYLGMIVEPILMPLRRIIPPMGGLDLSFLVLILLLNFIVRPLLGSLVVSVCSRLY